MQRAIIQLTHHLPPGKFLLPNVISSEYRLSKLIAQKIRKLYLSASVSAMTVEFPGVGTTLTETNANNNGGPRNKVGDKKGFHQLTPKSFNQFLQKPLCK